MTAHQPLTDDAHALCVEIVCDGCRTRLRRQMAREDLHALLDAPACPRCGARIDVVRVLGVACRETGWEEVRAPEDAITWADLQKAGITHCG